MPRYFDDALPQVNSEKIKPMMKMWDEKSTKMGKYWKLSSSCAALMKKFSRLSSPAR